MDREDVRRWIDRYVEAWRSHDAEQIGSLFTPDATYFTAPFRSPWEGREGIVRGWLDRKDQEGTWTFEWDVLGTDGDLAFVQGVTTYTADVPPTVYSNLWVIRLTGDGQSSRFVEWWMEHDS